jgi:heme-degrading monooxygenase HmoA
VVTIGMNYRVRAGKEQVFESAFESVLRAMAGTPGHSETRLYRRIGEPREYLIVSRWQDEEAFQAFTRSERFARVTSWGSQHVLDGPPEHTTYYEGSRSA